MLGFYKKLMKARQLLHICTRRTQTEAQSVNSRQGTHETTESGDEFVYLAGIFINLLVSFLRSSQTGLNLAMLKYDN